MLQQLGRLTTICDDGFSVSCAGDVDVAVLRDGEIDSSAKSPVDEEQDMEHHWKFVADGLRTYDSHGFPALHVLFTPKWVAKPFEAAKHLVWRRGSWFDADSGLPAPSSQYRCSESVFNRMSKFQICFRCMIVFANDQRQAQHAQFLLPCS